MVSVIIPVLNDRACLERCLRKVEKEAGVCEIIVADGGSRDGSRRAARGFGGVKVIETAPGRGRQMNRAARMARGDLLLFLHSDTRLEAGAIAELPELLGRRRAQFGAFRLRFEPAVWLPTLLAQLTRLTLPCTYFGDQAFFVERRFFIRTGGFPEVPLLEDVLWTRKAAGMGKAIRSPRFATTSARRFEREGVVRQLLVNLKILSLERWSGATPAELAPLYGDWSAEDLSRDSETASHAA